MLQGQREQRVRKDPQVHRVLQASKAKQVHLAREAQVGRQVSLEQQAQSDQGVLQVRSVQLVHKGQQERMALTVR